MVVNGAQELIKRKVICQKVSIFVGYTRDQLEAGHGSTRISAVTNLSSFFIEPVLRLYDKIANPYVQIRRLGLSFDNVCDEGCEGYDLFTNFEEVEKEKARENAVLELHRRYGKNAVLRGTNFLSEGTQRERNGFIGGHRAGYNDT